MSKRNTHAAKAARRAVRDAKTSGSRLPPLAEVHEISEMRRLAEAGECMPCGCDPVRLLADFGVQLTFDDVG